MTLPKKEFSAVEAAQYAKVPYASVDYWARTRLVVPSLAEANGTGTDRRYSFGDLVALRLVKELREQGIPTQALRKAVERVREVKNPLSECRLLVIGATVVWVKSDDEVIDVLRHPGQRILPFTVRVVDYPRVVQAISLAIAA
jgi:DNA-binding transcriptional MerR regulator